MKLKLILCLIVIPSLLLSCGNKNEKQEDTKNKDTQVSVDSPPVQDLNILCEETSTNYGEMVASVPYKLGPNDGVGLWAVCRNSERGSFNKNVVENLGIGIFHVIKDKKITIASADSFCKSDIASSEFVLTGCQYKLAGMKYGKERNVTGTYPWHKIEKGKWVKCSVKSIISIFDAFKIETKSLSSSEDQNETF